MHINMVTKTITVTEEAYQTIKSMKKENESFSQLFIRMKKNDNDISKFFGILKGDVNKLKAELKKEREEFSKSMSRRKNVFSRYISNT